MDALKSMADQTGNKQALIRPQGLATEQELV